MSIVVNSPSNTPSVELINNEENEKNNIKNEKHHKKDYVCKLWIALYKRCQPIFDAKKSNDLNNNNNNNNVESVINEEETKTNENETSNELTFEQLSEFMSNQQLIALVDTFWRVLQSFVQSKPLSKAKDTKQAKILISSFMIYLFPNDVLDVADTSQFDTLSEECYNAAQRVLTQVFNKMNVNSNLTYFDCQGAYKSILDFFNAFEIWQTNDKSKVSKSVLNFYEQWQRSYYVLQSSSMNEAQRDAILQTIQNNIENCKKKICQLLGTTETNRVCDEIDEKVKNDIKNDEHEHLPQHITNTTTNNNDNNNNNNNNDTILPTQLQNDEDEAKVALTTEEQLNARGVPYNMKTGTNLLSTNGNEIESKLNENNDATQESEFMSDVDGKKVLNLDSIVMYEASKNYWIKFEEEIEKENWSRLFELLSELLERIKKIAPKKDHAMLDDLIDVSFLQQTINHGLIDGKGFYGIFDGIWKQLRSMQAAISDKEWDLWQESIIKQMQSQNATWSKLLPQIFNAFLMKLDQIEDQIALINRIKQEKKQQNQ